MDTREELLIRWHELGERLPGYNQLTPGTLLALRELLEETRRVLSPSRDTSTVPPSPAKVQR